MSAYTDATRAFDAGHCKRQRHTFHARHDSRLASVCPTCQAETHERDGATVHTAACTVSRITTDADVLALMRACGL